MPNVITTKDGGVGTLVFEEAATRNALSQRLVDRIVEALEELAASRCRAVVLRAADGVDVWSAGHDVTELPEGDSDPLTWSDPLPPVVRAVEHFPAPVIAMVEGSVWGGACELVFACDLVVAAHDASFALTAARLGVPYDVSRALHFSNAASRHIVRELAFTAEPLGAKRAERLGIINHMVPIEELEAFTYDLAARIVRNAPLSVAAIKEQLRLLEDVHVLSSEDLARAQELRRAVYESEDYREGIRAFREGRAPEFKGA